MAVTVLLLALLSLAATAAAVTATPALSHDVPALLIAHAFSPASPFYSSSTRRSSFEDFVAAQSSRDTARAQALAGGTSGSGRFSASIASGRQLIQNPTYVVRALVGTPPQPLLAAVDPGADAAWFPCGHCSGCAAAPSPSFSPASSSSYHPLPCGSPQCALAPNPTCLPGANACGFNLTYGDSSLYASLVQDSLAVAGDVVKPYIFGCLVKSTGSSAPPQGLLGIGRGPLSFVSQTAQLYDSVFSYCLPSFKSLNFSGTLRLGPKGQPRKIKTTPLLRNPRRPSLYYVNMTAIVVGGKTVFIPPAALAFDPATGAGTVLDAGTMFTRLTAPAYAALRDEFRRQVAAPVAPPLGGFDTCYNTSVTTPEVKLVFDGGAEMALPEENVMIHSTYGSIACLAMAAGPASGVDAALNVVAGMQQQNHRVVFDVARARVGVAREACTAM